MKLYRIRNWSDLFENNRTRELKHMAWVPVPNRHDGDGYTTLVSRKNGAAIYGAWMVILQVASRCDPRGTLLRAPQKPHDAASIARITRLPEADIQAALDACTTETQWLEVEDIPTIPQEGAVKPQEGAPIPQDTAQERNGKNRTEQNGKNVWVACPEQLRLNALFKRRPTTKWSADELSAWKSITPLDNEDFTAVERFHATPGTYHRKDLLTLLRHWGEEVDRARQSDHKPIPEPKQIQESITVKML